MQERSKRDSSSNYPGTKPGNHRTRKESGKKTNKYNKYNKYNNRKGWTQKRETTTHDACCYGNRDSKL